MTTTRQTFTEFNESYIATRRNDSDLVIDIDMAQHTDGKSPMIVLRDGDRIVVLNPMKFNDHLCVDVHTFIDGEQARAGVIGMENGNRHALEETKATSHGWPAATVVALLIGEQGQAPA